MLAYLNGKVLKKTNKGLILNTGNVGYFVHISKNLLPEIETEQEIQFFIHHHVKEDASDLYGFSKYQDLEFFIQLIGISGIGPKVALEILNISPEKVKNAILSEDEVFICKIPGIGKKTAKRLILELKDKIQVDNLEPTHQSLSNTHNDALEALIKLGYHRKHIVQTIQALPQEVQEAEDIITYFLKNA